LTGDQMAKISELQATATDDLGFWKSVLLETRAQTMGLDATTLTGAHKQRQREAQDRLQKLNVALTIEGTTLAEINNIIAGRDTYDGEF